MADGKDVGAPRKREIGRRPLTGAWRRIPWHREGLAIPEADVGGLGIHYEATGEGFPLLLIMGLGANLDWWDPRLVEGLARDFRVIRFDNRGTGRSDDSEEEYTIRLFADDAVGLLDALGIARAHVLGISMGGMIAQELALAHPEKVERLVLAATHCGGSCAVPPSPDALGIMARIAGAPRAEETVRLTVLLCFTPAYAQENPEDVKTWVAEVLKAPTSRDTLLRQLGAIAGFDTHDRLPTLSIPTLVVHGEQDILIPPENGSILAKAIPGSHLVLLEHSAHGLAEDLGDAVRSVREFLGSDP